MSKNSTFWNNFVSAGGSTRPARASVEQLEQRLERQSLVSRALWELLRKHSGLEENDLIAKVAEIDLRDGSLDHRLSSPLLDCPDCGRKVNGRTRHCAYCGFSDFPTDVFEMP